MSSLFKLLPIAAVMSFALLIGQGSAFAQIDKDFQKCVDKANNGLAKLGKTQTKENTSCVKDATKGKQLPEACLSADLKGKVLKAKSKIAGCDAPNPIPIDKATAENAMVDEALELAHDLFGSDLDSASLGSPPKDQAKCAIAVIQKAGDIFAEKAKAFRKCKKDGMKSGAITDPASLEAACLPPSGIPDPKGMIAKRFAKLDDAIDKKCMGLMVPWTQFVNGRCAGLVGAGLRDCVDARVECRICNALNAADGLDADCDLGCSYYDLLAEADIIIQDGRVIDPETGRDEIAAVGVKDGEITVITPDSKWTFATSESQRVIDAGNLVVSPGFINTHTHEGIWNESMKAYVSDGITTWIGGNCGFSGTAEGSGSVAEFMDIVEAAGMYNNYAALTGHISLRRAVGVEQFGSPSQEQVDQMVTLLQNDLDVGGWGVSFGAFYDPGCEKATMIRLAQASRDKGGMAASHMRYNLMRLGETIMFANVLEEAIDTCRQSGVPFIVSHLTDVTYNNTTEYALDQILQAAVTEDLPITADIIGYDSFSNDFYTILGYGAVSVEMGLAMTGLDISDFQVLEDVYIDGELYMNQYDYCESIEQAQILSDAIGEGRAESPRVWCYIVKPENTKTALRRSYVFMGNDGSVSRNSETGELDGQPRSVACFSRLFGHWVREEGAITFMQAMHKATLAPALWLGLEKKGRLQVGCDADITLFNPDTIIDRASPIPDEHLLPPDGIPYVIVNGVLVVDQGVLTENKPGQMLRRNWTIRGDTQEVIESGNAYYGE